MTASRATILVADDDDRVAGLFTLALEEAGYEVLRARDGIETLEIIAVASVDVLLLDNRMPRMDGAGVIQALRAQQGTERLPIIVITAEGAIDARIRGLGAGADDYLAKPVDIDELIARVGAQLRNQAVWSETIHRELDERTWILGAIADVRMDRGVHEAAARIVGKLLAMDGCAYAAILEFRHAGPIVPLAVGSPATGAKAGGMALPGRAEFLRSQVKDGPFIHVLEDGRPNAFPAALGVGKLFIAPFQYSGEPLGAVVLGTVTTGRGAPTLSSRLFAAAVDSAGIVGNLLGPSLEASEHAASDRQRLGGILDAKAFRPVYQPLVRLTDRAIVGFEALTRFDDGTPPDVRFAEAMTAGLGLEYELAAVELALGGAIDLPSDAWLAVNVSPDVALAERRLTTTLGDAARRIVLELTEHVVIEDYAAMRAALRGLRPQTGVAIDDAGAGFASLRHILELEPELVKLDVSLVRGIESDPMRQAMVAGLVHFAATARCDLLGEAIETEAEAATLRALGVELGQGYLFGRPAPADDYAGIVKEANSAR